MSTNAAKGGWVESVFYLVLGAICLIFFVAALALGIRNSEAVFGGPPVTSLNLQLSVFTQPLDFLTGQLPASMVLPVLLGWPVVILELIYIFAYEKTILRTKRYNIMIGSGVFWACMASFAYDFVTNVNSAIVPGGLFPHVIFALVLAAALVFFPGAAVACIDHGVSSW